MTTLAEFRWIWIGLIVAVAVPLFDLGGMVTRELAGWLPLPWGHIGLGILLFAAAAALHFRSHWVACLHGLEAERQRAGAAARLLAGVEADVSAGVNIIKENLDLVAAGGQRPQEAELYLQGARAHADKLDQGIERLAGIRNGLSTTDDG